ncbi:MAG: hypothetical protein QM530_10385 [Phycisphaerales bacterium]|nr:hypothetical protein [Phycisphaerales bacterium]
MKFILILWFSYFGSKIVSAQDKIHLEWQVQYLGQNVPLNELYATKTDTLTIKELKWYISKVSLIQDDQIVFSDPTIAHLLNIADPKSLEIELKSRKKISFNKLQFCIGIDSLTNVSGALGGDLDPTKGMYWTWQSGYINIKIEGESNSITNRDFQLHLGGYLPPFAAIQTIVLPITNASNDIKIGIELASWLGQISLIGPAHIMSPSKEAVSMSKEFAKQFFILK